MQGPDRKMQLTGLIVSIMNTLTVELDVPICLILDDGQWTDSIGCQLLMDIWRRCPKVLVCISTRPRSEYGCDLLKKKLENLVESDRGVEILELSGLDIIATEEMLLEVFNTRIQESIRCVEGRLVEEIYKRTGGVPVMVEMLGKSLCERVKLGVTDGGMVRIAQGSEGIRSSSEGYLSDVLPVNAVGAVIAQLDKTSPAMRHVLLVACVAGQHFSLPTLAQILARNSGPKELANFELHTMEGQERLLDFLKSNDTFGFLDYTYEEHESVWTSDTETDDISTAPPSTHTGTTAGTNRVCTEVFFHHYVVHRSLYGTLIPSRRSALHAQYALYYTQLLANTQTMLPPNGERDSLIAAANYHLDHSRSLVSPATQLDLAEVAFHMYASRAIMSEALKAYERLEVLTRLYPDEVEGALDVVRRVRVYRHMCEIWHALIDYPKAWFFFQRAVGVVGWNCPKQYSWRWIRSTLEQVNLHLAMKSAVEKKTKRSRLKHQALS